MLREQVEKILEELDGNKLNANIEILIRKLLVAAVEVYEIPGTCGIRYSFDEAVNNPDAPITLEDSTLLQAIKGYRDDLRGDYVKTRS